MKIHSPILIYKTTFLLLLFSIIGLIGGEDEDIEIEEKNFFLGTWVSEKAYSAEWFMAKVKLKVDSENKVKCELLLNDDPEFFKDTFSSSGKVLYHDENIALLNFDESGATKMVFLRIPESENRINMFLFDKNGPIGVEEAMKEGGYPIRLNRVDENDSAQEMD